MWIFGSSVPGVSGYEEKHTLKIDPGSTSRTITLEFLVVRRLARLFVHRCTASLEYSICRISCFDIREHGKMKSLYRDNVGSSDHRNLWFQASTEL